MDTQEQVISDSEVKKAGLNVKALFFKLLFIIFVGGGLLWLYLHPQILKNIELLEKGTASEDVIAMQINQLQNQVATLQAQVMNIPQPDFSKFEDKVANLEKQNLNVIDSKADASIVLGMLTRVDKLENRLDKMSKISDDGALILSDAMLVKEAADDGSDFIYEAEVLNQLTDEKMPIRKDVSVIAEYSHNGIISERELINSFNQIVANIERKDSQEGTNWKEKLNNKLNEYIKINKTGENQSKVDTVKIISQIAELVNNGKIIKALKLIESSDSDDIRHNQALQEWFADAQNLVNFKQAIRNIAAYCLAEMKVNSLKNKE